MSGTAKIIAITGATGFVGQHLVPALLAENYVVRALIRSPNKLWPLWTDKPKFTAIQGDLSSDLTALTQGADVVIHMAGLIKARTRSEFMVINAFGSESMAKASQKNNVPKFIHVSSMVAREPQLSDYGASKRAGEQAISDHYNGEKTIIRAPAVFGPGDEATKPIFQFISKGHLLVAGGGWKNVNIAMTYIDDLVSFIVKSIEDEAPNRPVEPATITNMSWNDLATLCSEALDRPVKVRAVPSLILTPAAAITSVLLRLFGVGHLSLQKLREFRHPDWTSADEVDNPTPMIDALRKTALSYEK